MFIWNISADDLINDTDITDFLEAFCIFYKQLVWDCSNI